MKGFLNGLILSHKGKYFRKDNQRFASKNARYKLIKIILLKIFVVIKIISIFAPTK